MDPTLQDVLARLDRVSGQVDELRDGMRQAVAIAELDPDMALTRARKVLEFIVRDVFERHTSEGAGTRPLENLLQRLLKDGYLPKRLAAYANAVRELGNVGTHAFGEAVTKADVAQSLTQLTVILEWYFEHELPAATAGGAKPAVRPARPSADAAAGAAHGSGGGRAARRIGWIVALVVLAMVGGGGFWWWRGKGDPAPHPTAAEPEAADPVTSQQHDAGRKLPHPTVAEPAAADLVGAYRCVGDIGNGKQYHGNVEISKEGDCYWMKWNFPSQHHTGLALRDGDTLSAAIRDDDDDKYSGVAVYRVEAGGRLVGRWSDSNFPGATATETLTKADAAPRPSAEEPEGPDVVGAYDCAGDAGGGAQYHGDVEIEKDGDCYRIKWTLNNRQYVGLAIREGDTLSAAIRADGNDKYTGLIVYRIEKGGKLVGHWSFFAFEGKVLTETLTPKK